MNLIHVQSVGVSLGRAKDKMKPCDVEYIRADLCAPRATADVVSVINGYIDECGQAVGSVKGGDKLRLHYLQAAANEILRRITL